MKFVVGDITQLKSRALYKAIDREAPISLNQFPDVRSEFKFWFDNATLLNKRSISEYRATYYVSVYSDASDTGIGTHIPALGVRSHRNLEPEEEELSSTWRELTAICYGLQSFEGLLSGKSINWFTDNYAASLIVPKGSRKKTLTGPCSKDFQAL